MGKEHTEHTDSCLKGSWGFSFSHSGFSSETRERDCGDANGAWLRRSSFVGTARARGHGPGRHPRSPLYLYECACWSKGCAPTAPLGCLIFASHNDTSQVRAGEERHCGDDTRAQALQTACRAKLLVPGALHDRAGPAGILSA